MNKQVSKEHYDFKKYGHKDRWVSYFHQIKETLTLNPDSVLEIGVGDNVYGSYLKNNTNIKYQSLDIAEDLHPDFLGSATNIPLQDNAFDMVCAFEVLEHIPFDDFEKVLQELKRVSRRDVILSLPHFGPPVQLFFKLPFLPQIRFAFKIPYLIEHKFNGEHYWEIGKEGYPLSKIKTIISKYFYIEKDFIPFENQYHHFFVLKKYEYRK